MARKLTRRVTVSAVITAAKTIFRPGPEYRVSTALRNELKKKGVLDKDEKA